MSLDDLEARKESLTELEYRLARHVVTEIGRTMLAAESFAAGDYDQVGQLMYASHDSLRDDFDVSCDELDVLVEIAKQIGKAGGVIGSRMTGGGFGGCTVTLVETKRLDSVSAAISQEYKSKTGINATAFASRPAMGAHIVEMPT